jgi:hypothetical protein
MGDERAGVEAGSRDSDSDSRSPSSTEANRLGGMRPILCVRNALSTVMSWDTLTTEGRDKPVPRTGSRTHVAWCIREAQVGCDHRRDHGADPADVETIG